MKKKIRSSLPRCAAGLLLLAALACNKPPSSYVLEELQFIRASQPQVTIRLLSPHLSNGGALPQNYVCLPLGGSNVSPPLYWRNAPPNAQAFAIVLLENALHPNETVLWGLMNISNNVFSLVADINSTNLPTGSWMVYNDQYHDYYDGPCIGDGQPHPYTFRIYAMSAPIAERPGITTFADIEAAVSVATIQTCDLILYYPPRPPAE